MTQNWGEKEVENGKATIAHTITEDDGLGDFTLEAEYGETDNYQGATATSSAKIRRGTSITVQDLLANPGELVTLHADVTYQEGLLVIDGEVEFSIDNVLVGDSVTVSNGVAELEYTLPDNIVTGSTITAVYKGTDAPYYYAASTSSAAMITLRDATNVVVDSLSANRGETATITAVITDSTGMAITTGQATLYIDNGNGYETTGLTVDVSGGQAVFSYAIASTATSGTKNIRVDYIENDEHQAGSGTATLTIRNETSITAYDVSANPGEDVTLSALVTGEDGQPVSSGSAIFIINGEESSPCEVLGDGTVSYTYTVPADVSEDIIFTVQYVENNNYTSSISDEATITVRQGVIVTVPDVDAIIGDVITLEADVTTTSGEPVNEGIVTFTLE